MRSSSSSAEPAEQDPRGAFPRLYAGRRRVLLARLVLNGAAQAMVALGLAQLLHLGLADARLGVLDWPLVATMASVGLLTLLLRAAEAADAERLGQDYVMRVRLHLFERIAARPIRATGRRRWGVTMTRMISDLSSLRNWVSVGVARSIVASIMIGGLLLVVALLRPLTALAVGAMVLVSLAAAAALTPLLRGYVREARRRRGRLANNLGEKVFAFRTVRHFGRTDRELDRVRSHSRTLRDALVRRVRTAQTLRVLPHVTLPLAIAAVVVLAAFAEHGAEEAVVTVYLLGIVAGGLGELARAWDYRLAFEEGRRRIGEVLESPQVAEAPDAVALPGEGAVAVAFAGVALEGSLGPLRFEAEPGEVVLVAGPTGSGKSMVLALAARLLDPDRGEVRLAGVPLPSLKLDSLHEAVQLVAPELPLLRGSVAENLSYGLEGHDEAWLEQVANACGLDDEPQLLPEGLESRVEEQGQNLPHGLRARVALARAAAIRPRLLLVDDPAFAMDPAAADALERVVRLTGATTLVVGPEDNPPLRVDRAWRLGPAGPGPGEASREPGRGEVVALPARARG